MGVVAYGTLAFGEWFMEEGFFELDRDILWGFGADGVFFTVARETEIQFFAVE